MSTTANWGNLIAPGLRKVMVDEFNRYTPRYPSLFKVNKSSRAYEDDVAVVGLGKLEETTESGSVSSEDMLQGYKTRYNHKIFRKRVDVSREAFDDDQYNVLSKRSAALGKAASRTYDYYAMGDMFRNAFNTAKTSYGDNLPLASTLHTSTFGSSTQSNASSTGVVLSEPNLNTALLAVREVTDDKGELIDFMDAKPILMVSPYYKKTALEIVGSKYRSQTADNDMNYYFENEQIDVMVNPWMSAKSTNSTIGAGTDLYWFVILKGEHDLNFFMRVPFETEAETVKDTQTLSIYGYTRFSYGWSDWRGVWGSKGDAAAYSS